MAAISSEPSDKPQNRIIHQGRRLKHARLSKGYTLKQLAARVNCSESMISKLENSRLSPSLAMLHRLAEELDTTAADLLIQADDAEETNDVVVFSSGRLNGEQNPNEDGDVKIWYDRILPLDKSGLLQVSIQHLLPGAEQTRFLAHEGEEFIFVLDGVFDIIFRERSYTLETGQGISFPSTRAHRYRNGHDLPTRTLWAGTPPTL